MSTVEGRLEKEDLSWLAVEGRSCCGVSLEVREAGDDACFGRCSWPVGWRSVRWPGREADGNEQLGRRGTALLLFSRRWGRMEERPGDENERVRGLCSVKEKGRGRGEVALWGEL